MFLNYQQATEEIKREIKKFLEINDNENMTTQNLWDAAKAVILPQETRKTFNIQHNFTTKTTGNIRTKKKPKISRRKEIIKIQAEIMKKK